MLIRLSKHFNQSPDQISTLQLKEYLYHCKEKQGLSNSFINQTISAVNILRKDVLGLAWDQGIGIKRPRMNHHLPDILSKGQVDQLIEVRPNFKHKAIIALLYSTGMRMDELIHLKIADIDSKRMVIRIARSKGNKSRDVMLSDSALVLLRMYYTVFYPKPIIYVFEAGGQPGAPYSRTSVTKIVKSAAKRAGITKPIYPHSLRHAFATHLVEQGVNLKLIQQLLGHASIQSTMLYLRLLGIDSSFKSPFDQP